MGTMGQLQARQPELGGEKGRLEKGDRGGYKGGREADEKGQREQIRRWVVSFLKKCGKLGGES